MRTVVLGARGLLGTEVAKVFPGLHPFKHELDLNSEISIQGYFKKNKPDLVINCAAASNVDESERDPWRCTLTNALGPSWLALACKERGATLIHISTDYVFGNGLFTEKDTPNPLNQYGCIKAAGEAFVLINPRTYVLRVSSLYGRARSCHSEWVLNSLKTKKAVRICEDMIGSPSFTEDLALWIKELVLKEPEYGIYHAVPHGQVSRYDFAEKMLDLLKVKKRYLDRIKIENLGLPAKRPNRPILFNQKWVTRVGDLPHWEDSLKRYLKTLKLN